MYCFRVEFENGVAAPVTDIFCMTESEYRADPASDFDFTQPIPTEPTLWGYETYTIAEEVIRNQEMATYIHNLEIAREDARQKRRAMMARKFLNA